MFGPDVNMENSYEDSAAMRRKHYHNNVLQSLAETLEVLSAETTETKREVHCHPFEIPDEPIEQKEILNEEIREWHRAQSAREEEGQFSPRQTDSTGVSLTFENEEPVPFQRVLVEGEETSGVSVPFC